MGDDTIAGGMGDDTITGGDGSDVAVFRGNQDDFTFAVAGGGTLTVTISIRDGLGSGYDLGVETLRFNDGDLTVTATQDGDVTLTGTDGVDDVVTVVGSTAVTLEGVEGRYPHGWRWRRYHYGSCRR